MSQSYSKILLTNSNDINISTIIDSINSDKDFIFGVETTRFICYYYKCYDVFVLKDQYTVKDYFGIDIINNDYNILFYVRDYTNSKGLRKLFLKLSALYTTIYQDNIIGINLTDNRDKYTFINIYQNERQ